jgi:uncharacterized repeat protein (TIGR01451 family)
MPKPFMTHQKRFSRLVLLLTLFTALCAGLFSPRAEHVEAKPLGANALDVVISEVAWGGTAANTNHEWIELYNTTSSAIDLTGWTLETSDGSPAVINLSGSIPAYSVFLLESSADAPISNIVANQTYTGTLSNSGETLTLRDNLNNPIDTANNSLGGWDAGSGAPGYYSMERVGFTADSVTAWVANDGVKRNGLDATIPTPNPINGTAGAIKIDLSLSMTVSNPAPTVGSNVTFTITVNNNSTFPASNITVNDSFPVGLSYNSDDGGGAYNSGTGDWVIPVLTGGSSATLNIDVTVNNLPAVTTVEITSFNQLLDSDSIPNNSSISEDDYATIQLLPKISGLNITNDANNTNPTAGTNIVFTITAENDAGNPYDASNVSVAAQLPAGLDYISHSAPSGTTYNSGTGIWNIGSLPIGTIETLSITAQVTGSGIIGFGATLTSDEYVNETDTESIIVSTSGVADLTLMHQDIVPTGVAGRVKLKLRLANGGPGTATGIQVRDVLPSGLDYYKAEATIGSYSPSTGIWSISSLASGDPAVLTLTVDVASSGASTSNFAEVWASNQFDPNSTPANGSNSEDDNDTLEVPIADLRLTQSVDVASNTAIFTITINNAGPDDATNVEVTADLPNLSNYTYVSSGATTGSYTSASGIWTVGPLADGATASLVITTAFTGSLQTNWVEITNVDQVDPDSVPGNDSQNEDDDASAPSTDLRLEMSVNDTTPAFNSRVEFTLKVTNDGPFNASGVKVRDSLPGGLTFISANPAGNYDPISGLWTIGTLTDGASATIQINARMTSYGTFANKAEVWRSNLLDPDSTPGNGSTNEDDDASSTVVLIPLATQTPTASPVRAVIINEIAWAGTSSSFPDDEWIELYNPTSSAITLTGWKLRASDGTPFITLSGKIPAGGYYLLERDSDSTVSDIAANLIYTGSLSNIGETITLTDPIGRIIDTANGNGGTWPKGSSSTYGTMERTGTSFETDSSWITNTGVKRNGKTASGGNILGTPKNANSAASFTATPARTITRTPTPSRTPTFAPPVIDPRPIINEVLARPGYDWNQDGAVDVFDEFIEIKNLTSIDISLTGWRLDKIVPAGTAAKSFSLPGVTLKPGERVVFYTQQTNLLLSDGGETVRLVNASGKIYDAFTYELARAEDKSFCRLPDGTPGNSWFEDCIPTPNLSNTREGQAPVSPDNSASPFCNLPDTIPLDFFIPECNGYGGAIWNPFYWDFTNWLDKLFIQQTDEKWPSFIE